MVSIYTDDGTYISSFECRKMKGIHFQRNKILNLIKQHVDVELLIEIKKQIEELENKVFHFYDDDSKTNS